MKAEDSQEVANLMAYPKGTAGSIMTTEFFSLPEDTSAREAIQLTATGDEGRDRLLYLSDGSSTVGSPASCRYVNYWSSHRRLPSTVSSPAT